MLVVSGKGGTSSSFRPSLLSFLQLRPSSPTTYITRDFQSLFSSSIGLYVVRGTNPTTTQRHGTSNLYRKGRSFLPLLLPPPRLLLHRTPFPHFTLPPTHHSVHLYIQWNSSSPPHRTQTRNPPLLRSLDAREDLPRELGLPRDVVPSPLRRG